MALSVRANSRQIPKDVEYTANSLYDDLMYGYLQSISLPGDDGVRHIKASNVSFVKLADALGITRQTASKQFKGLQVLGLVEKKNGTVYLPHLDNTEATLVPHDVLELLVAQKMSYLVTIYAYFLKVSPMYEGKAIQFNHTGLKDVLGICNSTSSNSYILTNCYEKLTELGLAEFKMTTHTDGGVFSTKSWCMNLKNTIE